LPSWSLSSPLHGTGKHHKEKFWKILYEKLLCKKYLQLDHKTSKEGFNYSLVGVSKTGRYWLISNEQALIFESREGFSKVLDTPESPQDKIELKKQEQRQKYLDQAFEKGIKFNSVVPKFSLCSLQSFMRGAEFKNDENFPNITQSPLATSIKQEMLYIR
jgi:hypothetical protein